MKEWLTKENRKDRCKCCNHFRNEHSDMETSLGNDSHMCYKNKRIKGVIYNCSCGRFEPQLKTKREK